ncbi:MAG: putative glycosyltransferase, exosortase G system-associated [Firmicutes bacterium]|nr:putative glycosyltransferase, exosortase G system-associated [Bacillota bacterium]
MLKAALLRFALFWGIWILVPIAIDGISAIAYLWASLTHAELATGDSGVKRPAILATILIPVYNAERSLYRCIESLASQTYPHSAMEIICMGNAVTDNSIREFTRAQARFGSLNAMWVSLSQRGKARALNAGVLLSKGTVVINIDADTRLGPNAVERMVAAFEDDPDLGAASGSIHVDLLPPGAPWWWRLLNACEILEYLAAFRIGRRFQSRQNAVFTLSGAFSAFRRSVVLSTHLYDDKTVSEDTNLTFDIRNVEGGRWRIACIQGAEAFVEPTLSLSKLMSQRLRWQRGQLEVASLYPRYWRTNPISALTHFTSRILLGDHTLSFPRLAWTFIIPYLYLLGYSLPLVAAALWLTYFMYVIVEFLFLLSIRKALWAAYRMPIGNWWHLSLVMPVYRSLIYWFRLAGMIYALCEPASWSAENEIERVKKEAYRLWSRLRRTTERAVARRGGAV